MAKILDILLQRSDINIPWGFQIRGGRDLNCQPFISSVTFGTLAAQYLSAGGKVVQLERRNAEGLLQSDIEYLLERDGKSLHLIVQTSPNIAYTESRRVSVDRSSVNSSVSRPNTPYEYKPFIKLGLRDDGARSPFLTMSTDDEDINIDLHVEYKQTLYQEKLIPQIEISKDHKKEVISPHSNQKRMQVLSENFMKTVFPEKKGIYEVFNPPRYAKEETERKPQGNTVGDVPQPPPPPSFPGSIPGRKLKTEISEKSHEPPAAIQNAMMTKDKKPFTYTPGGLDLSEIKSPKMARRINRNACADEIPGEPAPTTGNQLAPPNATSPGAYYQPPSSYLQGHGVPPPPPPPLPGNASPNPPLPPPPPTVSSSVPKPSISPHRPPQGGFDPNEILARVNKNHNQNQNAELKQDNYQSNSYHNEPVQMYSSPVQDRIEPEYRFESKPAQNEHSSGNTTRINEPGHIYVPQIAPKLQNEPGSIYVPTVPNSSHNSRGQLGSIYIPPVTNMTEETNTPPSASSYGYQIQSPPSTASPTSPLSQTELNKAPAPWMNRYNNQPAVPSWASREPESPKTSNTRIIPIQIEGRDPPPTVNQKSQQQPYQQQQQPYQQQQQPYQQQQQYYQHQQPQQYQYQQQQQQSPPPPPPVRQQPSSNSRMIPIQIEGANRSVNNSESRAPGPTYNQNKFNPMTPSSPTPYSPSETFVDQKPQWASVQPRPFQVIQKTAESPQEQQRVQLIENQKQGQGRSPQQRYQPPPPEYGTYNTAGVPLSQLRKMQLSEDDRALMDKFKQQVEKHENGDITDENANPRYRGGHIPSRVFKMLDESVDDENYLHRESDPRYRGAAIPSRAFRMLQCMTDTAGDVSPQVSRVPARNPATRQQADGQYQSEGPQSPYIPPSEQQVQEPRKYTGGSIPSRSFKMLQAMTGQEGARNQSSPNSPSGRETPVSGMNRWCPSPAPSPMDPYWGYYPADPYLIYNYISDLNAAYGFPPTQPYPSRPPSCHFQRCNYISDSDNEQGYSSTDELAQYYANYRRNMAYAQYQQQQHQFIDPHYQEGNYESQSESPPTKASTTPIISVTSDSSSSVPNKRNDKSPKVKKSKETPKNQEQKHDVKKTEQIAKQNKTEGNKKSNDSSDESVSTSESESETDTEVEDEKEGVKKLKKSSQKLNQTGSLQALKSVSDVNIYTSESSATVTNDEWEDCESKLGDDDRELEEEEQEEEEDEEEEEEEEEEESSEEEVENQVPEDNLPHQLSVIYEESEYSDVESIKRTNSRRSGRSTTKSITSESGESSATLDHGEDESDDDVLDSEASVTVRLPLQLKFSRTDNDEDVTTVIVGDSEMKKGVTQNLESLRVSKEKVSDKSEELKIEPEVIEIGNEEEDDYKSDEADVSFTFTIPARSDSMVTVVSNDIIKNREEAVEQCSNEPEVVEEKEECIVKEVSCDNMEDTGKTEEIVEETKECESVIDAEVTVSLSLPLKKPKPKEECKFVVEDGNNLDRSSYDSKTEESDSTHYEDDSSSTSVQSVDTVVKDKEDTDDEVTERVEEVKENSNKIESFKSWIDRENNKDWNETKKTAESVRNDIGETKPYDGSDQADSKDGENMSYKAGVGKLQEMISSLLENTKITINNTSDITKEEMYDNGGISSKSESNSSIKKLKKNSKDSQEESEEDDSGVTSDMSTKHQNSETDGDTESDFSELSKMTQFQRASTHSRLFKLLQEECEKEDNEEDKEGEGEEREEKEENRTLIRNDSKDSKSSTSPVHLDHKPNTESISARKERLTLPLNPNVHSEVDSLSSSSGVTSPSSPTVTDRLVKELVQSLLNKKKGKKFKKLPMAKLHAAALRILQEDMDPYDTSSTSASGDDGFFMSPVQKKVHSQPTASFRDPNGMENHNIEYQNNVYGDNYYDYLNYYNSWGSAPGYYPEAEYDIMPSRAFRFLNGHPGHYYQTSLDGFKARCPRIPNQIHDPTMANGKDTPVLNTIQETSYFDANDDCYRMSFADKRERVSKVLEKSSKA